MNKFSAYNQHPASQNVDSNRARAPIPRSQDQQNSQSQSSWEQQGSHRGLTPISTSSAIHNRPASGSNSPSRSLYSPTSSHPYITTTAAAAAANHPVSSRHSSISSINSLAASAVLATGPSASTTRSRIVVGSGSSGSSLVAGGVSTGGGLSRLARHSPSLSISTTAGSPTSSVGPYSASGSSAHLNSLVTSQLNILLSTIKPDTDRAKWEVQAEKIRKLINESGMELFTTYFRRLVQSNASTIFPGGTRAATNENSGQYQLLIDEVQKIGKDPHQADKVAQSLDTSDGELFRDFDLSRFVEHFRLTLFAKIALVLACRSASKADLRSKADAILIENFQAFLSTLHVPQTTDPDSEFPPSILASIIERLIQDPPRDWGDEQRDNLFYASRLRYQNLRLRLPPIVESAMFLDELLSSQDSRLARLVQRAGPKATTSRDDCKELLAGAETRDISYNQVANALLFMAIAQNGDAYDAGVFVEALRQHRAGSKIDWTDVVQGFDREHLRVTKKQFLALYNALLPLAREYANFDIQTLWGGTPWQCPETQLSFVVAFLSTTGDELDVMQIPNLRQAFDLTEFSTASDHVRAFAEQAIKHPLVSRDATEALFTMVFRSQESYAMAQMLAIPETVINTNMTVFVCAASAVPKPWLPLQDQALKQLFYPFLMKQHDNYDFVMHSLWQHDKTWIATRMVEFYQQDQLLMSLIFEHALEHGWLDILFTIQSGFSVDLATYAHGRGACNLEEWAQQHISALGPPHFARAVHDFVNSKMDDETMVQREHTAPTTQSLALKTVYTLLVLIATAPEEVVGPLYRRCLQLYPRLFNYEEDDQRNAVLDANDERGHQLPENSTKEMEERYKEMYGGTTNPENLVSDLRRQKASSDPQDQELFAAMLFGLFEEYNCFGEYPNEALATTAVLFGGLVSHQVLSVIAEQAAIFMIFEAVSEYGPDDPMYRFGLQALIHVLPRLKEWPHLADRILHTPSLRGTQAVVAAENTLKELHQDEVGVNGDGANGITNGVVDDEFGADALSAFTAIQVDAPIQENFYEEPNEDISDKVMFVLNNVSKRNFDEKFKEIDEALEDKYLSWFAHYLVDELAKSQPNFQSLYLNVLEKFNKKLLWAEVLRETFLSCQKMLNAQATMDNQHERALLKNLATWLGSITLARNEPILHRNLSFKDLLLEAYDSQRLLVAIPFTCKALILAKHSKVFRPPNPWMMEQLGVLSEFYHRIELKLNLKFEIEVLCRDLEIDIKTIEPLDAIRSRQLLDQAMIPQYVPDGGPDAFGDMALMGLSKRGPNERFSPDAVIQAVPDLGGMLQIPQAVGNITQQQLRNIFVNAAQQAIYEIIAPVVERSVTIASISTSELIQKDFATESDESKVRNSAHTVVKALSGSLALVTCKEPLRMSITNNIRLMAARNLPEQLPEGQILMFVNDNIDTVCSLVEGAAEEHSLAEIDLQLQQALEDRRQHNDQRPNEAFARTPVSRWATLIPEPFRQDQNGLNRQQLALYEDFGRQARITPAAHANNMSQDSRNQIPDVLSENFLPSLPTPAEVPAMPRTAQPHRMHGLQTPQSQLNGYLDNQTIQQRIMELLAELQLASREATEENVSQIGEASAIRRVYGSLVGFIENAPEPNGLSAVCGQQCLTVIYGEAHKRLEVEVFVRLLVQLCRMSVSSGRAITMHLQTAEDDRIYNAVATIALFNERLIDVGHIDSMTARGIKNRRPVVLPFLKDVLDELLLGEDPVFRTDFVLTYEALGQWLSEDHTVELGKEIMSKLRTPSHQINGMPSPESDTAKADQQEYVFEEWLRLQHKDLPLRTYLAFVAQLHNKGIVSGADETVTFFRTALDMACGEFERVINNPYGTQDQAFIAIDAVAKLMVLVVVYQASSDSAADTNKANNLAGLLRMVILVLQDHHVKQGDRFNGRVFFRLFSTLLCELHEHRQQLSAEEQHKIRYTIFEALLALRPRYFPGYMHGWMASISHRLLVPDFLAGGRANGGWSMFAKLLTVLFLDLADLLSVSETLPATQDFYRGVLRFFTMLHHDFPEFLIENHMQLNANIPTQCVQLQNMVNSAVTRGAFNDQPDPFTPGLKVNRLEQVRQAPAVHSDMGKVLETAGVKIIADKVCNGSDLDDQEFNYILSAVDRPDGQICPILHNALVLYIGVHATSASSVFSAGTPPARLLERLLRESRSEARYALISAITNQVRYVNAHTHYFSTALQHMFSIGSAEQQEQIMRVLCERLMVPRPHPWGVIVLMLEMLKNSTYDIWSLPWMKAAPQVEQMLTNLASSQDSRLMRSPLSSFM